MTHIDDELTDEEARLIVKDLITTTDHIDDLVHLVTQDYPPGISNAAAAKLIEKFEESSFPRRMLDHILVVVEYADEPYKSKASEIIRNNT